jgi:hypothetical protein
VGNGDEGKVMSGEGAIGDKVFVGDGKDEDWEFDVDEADLDFDDLFFLRGGSEDNGSDEASEREGRGTKWGWGCCEM